MNVLRHLSVGVLHLTEQARVMEPLSLRKLLELVEPSAQGEDFPEEKQFLCSVIPSFCPRDCQTPNSGLDSSIPREAI